MKILCLALMLSAFMVGTRTLADCLQTRKLKLQTKLSIEIIFLLTWFFISYSFPGNLGAAVLFTLVWLLLFLSLQNIIQWLRARSFRSDTEGFLDRVIMNLLSGNSIRISCFQAVSVGDVFSQQELKRILAWVFDEQDFSGCSNFSHLLAGELKSIATQSHSALSRLKGLRRNLSLESEFRQKSEQIKGRILIQAVFMLGMYFAVLTFTLRNQSQMDLQIVGVSAALFAFGFGWTIIDGRKIKWRT